MRDLAEASPDLLPHGYTINPASSTWKDSWTIGASGVAVVNFENKLDSTGDYHTQYMRPDIIDWDYFAQDPSSSSRFRSRSTTAGCSRTG